MISSKRPRGQAEACRPRLCDRISPPCGWGGLVAVVGTDEPPAAVTLNPWGPILGTVLCGAEHLHSGRRLRTPGVNVAPDRMGLIVAHSAGIADAVFLVFSIRAGLIAGMVDADRPGGAIGHAEQQGPSPETGLLPVGSSLADAVAVANVAVGIGVVVVAGNARTGRRFAGVTLAHDAELRVAVVNHGAVEVRLAVVETVAGTLVAVSVVEADARVAMRSVGLVRTNAAVARSEKHALVIGARLAVVAIRIAQAFVHRDFRVGFLFGLGGIRVPVGNDVPVGGLGVVHLFFAFVRVAVGEHRIGVAVDFDVGAAVKSVMRADFRTLGGNERRIRFLRRARRHVVAQGDVVAFGGAGAVRGGDARVPRRVQPRAGLLSAAAFRTRARRAGGVDGIFLAGGPALQPGHGRPGHELRAGADVGGGVGVGFFGLGLFAFVRVAVHGRVAVRGFAFAFLFGRFRGIPVFGLGVAVGLGGLVGVAVHGRVAVDDVLGGVFARRRTTDGEQGRDQGNQNQQHRVFHGFKLLCGREHAFNFHRRTKHYALYLAEFITWHKANYQRDNQLCTKCLFF